MKFFKKIGISFVLLIGIVAIAVFIYIQVLTPSYSGKIKIEGAEGTEVYFDTIGVPHIFADTEEKAMVALGYMHAKERLWQMELLRRIAAGRLSEILGKDLVDVDVFFSSLGIDETVQKQVLTFKENPEVKTLVEAYLKGINNYIDKGVTPVEFTLLGIKKEHYTVKDMYYVVAYMAFNFAHGFKVDPVLSYIKSTYGEKYLEDLSIGVDKNTVYQENDNSINHQAFSQVSKVLKKLPFPQFIGSNGWVVGPSKTESGKVLFENDPHIGYTQPCVWYQSHIKTPKYERYGFHLGLIPFPLLSHNKEYAMGVTMFENDDLNFYTFQNHPTDSTKYITSTGEHNYDYIKKIIKIKGGETKEITIKKTILGTVFNSRMQTLDSVAPIAVQWVYNEKPSKVLKTAHGMNHAKHIQDFETKLGDLSAPGLNFIYGDKQGNIGLWSAAKLYAFNEEINTKFILNGMDRLQTSKKWLPFTKNPKAINPSKGYVVTSNTQPEAVDGVLYQGYYMPEDRAVAIHKGLNKKTKVSVNDVKSLATSHTNTTVLKNVKNIVRGIDLEVLNPYELFVLDRLMKWKGNYNLDNIEPTIYHKLNYKLLKHTFKDELGEIYFDEFVNSTLCNKTENKYVRNPKSVWWDDVKTTPKETFQDIVMKAYQETVAELKIQLGEHVEDWKWRRVHTVTHEHALAKIDMLKDLLNVGAYSIVGGNETINNTMFDYTEDGVYKVNAGPSTRRVVDFEDIENSWAVVPTGQSGNFLSPYYKNQANYYNSGKYYKMLMNEKEIKQLTQKIVFE